MTTVETNADGERVAYVKLDPREYKRLKDSHAKLVAACEAAEKIIDGWLFDREVSPDSETLAQLRAALADAKGEA